MMGRRAPFRAALALLAGCAAFSGVPCHASTLEAVCFAPDEACDRLIIREIDSAQREILVAAYEFTDRHIAQALAAAKQRGADVRVIMDREHAADRYSVVDYLRAQAIPVFLDRVHRIQHQKTMVFDGQRVELGSYTTRLWPPQKTAKTPCSSLVPTSLANSATNG